MKRILGAIVLGVVGLQCVAADTDVSTSLNLGKIPAHGDWEFIYTEKTNYQLCVLSVESLYLSGGMDSNMTTITHFSTAMTVTTWTAKQGVRIDCNSFQNSVLIMTTDYQ